jgi:nucleoside-diphosphate-sugar epimerase
VDAADPAAQDLVAGCDAVLHFAGEPSPAGARADPAGAVQRNAGTTVNLLEGCARHGAALVYPSPSAPRRCAPARTPYALSKRLGEEACRLHAARTCVVRLTSVFGPGQVTWEGRHGRHRGLRRARAAGEAITIPGDPSARATSSTSTTWCSRSRGSPSGAAWADAVTLASGTATPLRRAAELVRDAAGTDVPDPHPGRDLPPGRTSPTPPSPTGPARPSVPSRRLSRSMSTGSAAIPQLKAAPEAEQLAERLRAGLARAGALPMPRARRRRRATRQAVRTVLEAAAGRDLALTAEAPVAWPSGASCASTASTTRRARGSSGPPTSPPGIGSPVLTIHLFVPLTPEEFRDRGPLDEEAVTAFLTCFAEACRPAGWRRSSRTSRPSCACARAAST